MFGTTISRRISIVRIGYWHWKTLPLAESASIETSSMSPSFSISILSIVRVIVQERIVTHWHQQRQRQHLYTLAKSLSMFTRQHWQTLAEAESLFLFTRQHCQRQIIVFVHEEPSVEADHCFCLLFSIGRHQQRQLIYFVCKKTLVKIGTRRGRFDRHWQRQLIIFVCEAAPADIVISRVSINRGIS